MSRKHLLAAAVAVALLLGALAVGVGVTRGPTDRERRGGSEHTAEGIGPSSGGPDGEAGLDGGSERDASLTGTDSAAVPEDLPDLTPDVIAELEEREARIEALREQVASLTDRMLELEMGGDLAASDRVAEQAESVEAELEAQQEALEARQREEHIEIDDPLYGADDEE